MRLKATCETEEKRSAWSILLFRLEEQSTSTIELDDTRRAISSLYEMLLGELGEGSVKIYVASTRPSVELDLSFSSSFCTFMQALRSSPASGSPALPLSSSSDLTMHA